MWQILGRALRTGIVTASLETLEAPAPPAMKGRPALQVDLCDGNAACEAACPTGAIRLGMVSRNESRDAAPRRRWRIDYGACIFCGRCAEVCATGALRLTGDYALATLHREDLVFTTTVRAQDPGAEETL